MNRKFSQYMMVTLVVFFSGSMAAYATGFNISNVGGGGYDLVSYFKDGKAERGTGWHAAVHEGTTYLFANKKNRSQFIKAPDNYLPQFGGYCAYGAAVGKKFYADPTVWKIVDGKLYLNLDKKIQKKWVSDLSDNLKKGYANWPKIQNANPEGA